MFDVVMWLEMMGGLPIYLDMRCIEREVAQTNEKTLQNIYIYIYKCRLHESTKAW